MCASAPQYKTLQSDSQGPHHAVRFFTEASRVSAVTLKLESGFDRTAWISPTPTRTRRMVRPRRRVGVRPRSRTPLWMPPTSPTGRQRIRVPFSPETAGQRHRQHRVLTAPAGTAGSSTRPSCSPASGCILHFGAVDYRAKVWVNGQLAAEHEGGYTPFCADITDLPRTPAARRPSPSGPRTTRRSLEAARQAGLAAPPALDLVPAHDRHLAARLAGARRPPPASASSAGRPTSSAGRSASRRRLGRRPPRRPAAQRQALRRRHRCWRTTPTPSSPARSTAASRSPTPASTTTATSCSGVPQRPTLIDAELQLTTQRRRTARHGAQLHRAPLDRRPGRQVRAQRPAATSCAWCSTRATGPRPA